LLAGSKSNTVVTKIKDGVVSRDKNIPKNPPRSHRGIKIQSHKSRNA